jgi:pilus assembly protein CpaF
LVQQGFVTAEALEFLGACVQARLNMAISGPPGSGKRALLQALVHLADADGQILAVQNPDEPPLERKGVTTLRANLHPPKGQQRVTRHYLLTLAPKMHPQGLILDRVDGAEAVLLLKLLFAMDGVIFSIIAESPKDALFKLENWGLLHGNGLDSRTIRRILSSSLDLITHLVRGDKGSPVVASLTEVMEVESDTPTLRDIFLRQDVERQEGKPDGELRPTGTKPRFLDRLEMLGISLPKDIFV